MDRSVCPRFLFRCARLAALLLACAAVLAALDTSKLKPRGYVNDFAGVLDPAVAARLEAYAAEVERSTGAQMAFVTVDTLDGEPIEDATNRLYREWGVGKKGKDEGLMFLLAVRDHKQRAEIGYGLEPILPDGYVGSVLRSLRPALRQENYGAAMLALAQDFGSRIAQARGVAIENMQPMRRVRLRSQSSIPWPLLLGGLFFVLWLVGRASGGGGGGMGGFLTGMLLGNLMGRSRGWGGGGFGGYDGGGGGGFGGFGGGDSGGGGASSDW